MLGRRRSPVRWPDARYHRSIQHYVDFLRELTFPERLAVASLHGPIEPVIVKEAFDGRRVLEQTCQNDWLARPGIRLQALVGAVAEQGIAHGACDADLTTEMARIGEKIAATLRR